MHAVLRRELPSYPEACRPRTSRPVQVKRCGYQSNGEKASSTTQLLRNTCASSWVHPYAADWRSNLKPQNHVHTGHIRTLPGLPVLWDRLSHVARTIPHAHNMPEQGYMLTFTNRMLNRAPTQTDIQDDPHLARLCAEYLICFGQPERRGLGPYSGPWDLRLDQWSLPVGPRRCRSNLARDCVTLSPISWDVPTCWFRPDPRNGYCSLQQALPHSWRNGSPAGRNISYGHTTPQTPFQASKVRLEVSLQRGTCTSRDCVSNHSHTAVFSSKRYSWRRIRRSTQHFGSPGEGLLPLLPDIRAAELLATLLVSASRRGNANIVASASGSFKAQATSLRPIGIIHVAGTA
jgi:hypothetical protein